MTISIPDTLTTDNSEKYIVSIRLRSGGLSFSGYDPSAGGSFFYRETEFDRAVSFISSLKEFFFAHEFLTWTYKRINVICVLRNIAWSLIIIGGTVRKGIYWISAFLHWNCIA